MTTQSLATDTRFTRVAEIIAQELNLSEDTAISRGLDLQGDFGADSQDMLSILIAIEEAFGLAHQYSWLNDQGLIETNIGRIVDRVGQCVSKQNSELQPQDVSCQVYPS